MSDLSKDRPGITGDTTVEQDPAAPESKQPQPDSRQPSSPVDTGAEKDTGSGTNDGPEVSAKTRSNRENSLKSTGPRSDAGRATSSRNAVKHGLFVEDLTRHLSAEQLERYQSFVAGIVDDLHPVGDLESHLAQRVADIQFRLHLLRTAEFKIYLGAAIPNDTMEGCLMKSGNPIGLASLYDQRFQRSFSKTMEELRRVQQARLEQEKRAVEELKAIAAAHMQQNAPFDPARFGFVISRDLLFDKVRLGNAKKLAVQGRGDGIVEQKVVAMLAGGPQKAA